MHYVKEKVWLDKKIDQSTLVKDLTARNAALVCNVSGPVRTTEYPLARAMGIII